MAAAAAARHFILKSVRRWRGGGRRTCQQRPRQLQPLEEEKKNGYFNQKVSFVFVEEPQELCALRVEADRAAGGGDDIG